MHGADAAIRKKKECDEVDAAFSILRIIEPTYYLINPPPTLSFV